MKKIRDIIIAIGISLLYSSCNEIGSSDSNVGVDVPSSDNSAEVKKISLKKETTEVPILVVVMNWNDYSESDEQLWHDKIFNKETNSLARYYSDYTAGNLELTPAAETYGTVNDGVIVVDMQENHPGDSEEVFRDTFITKAITSNTVDNNINFSSFDKDGNGIVSFTELQILFVVAGGEVSYGDTPRNSIWAHAWNYEDSTPPVVDGVTLMKASNDFYELGYYLRMGATHEIDGPNPHKATVGIIAHEMGHSLLGQWDLYDLSGYGSGLGFYDIMSGGAWASKLGDLYDGETPTQFSAYSVIDSYYAKDITDVETPDSVTLNCSSGESLKLETSQENEYFLLECRDSARDISDKSFVSADASFTDNKLFAVLYHVDTKKGDNSESGLQTPAHHYMVSVVERSSASLMTSTPGIDAEYNDVYSDGSEISKIQTVLYDGTQTGYSITVLSSNYTDRTMTFSIRK